MLSRHNQNRSRCAELFCRRCAPTMPSWLRSLLISTAMWAAVKAFLPETPRISWSHADHVEHSKLNRAESRRQPARRALHARLMTCHEFPRTATPTPGELGLHQKRAIAPYPGQARDALGRGGFNREEFLRALGLSSSAAAIACVAALPNGPQAASAAETLLAVDAAESRRVAGDDRGSESKERQGASPTESAASSAVSGLVAGAAVSTSKQLLLHPVDTVKTRLQVKRDGSSDETPPDLFRGLYDGVVPPLLAGLPSGALFFSAKDACSTAIRNAVGPGYADLTTIAAVGLAQFPYWGLRTPAELLKTRSQARVLSQGEGGLGAAKAIVADEGVKGLYTGYASNVAYAFPADAIKFLVYESLKRSAKKAKGGAKLSTLEAAVLGSGASLVAQATTTPLDVVRTRVMSASAGDPEYEGGVPGVLWTIGREEGFSALWAGTTPRIARSVLSGAIQFGAYEFVKGLFGVEPKKLG